MLENTRFVPVDVLQSFIRDVFTGVGVPKEDAEISAQTLIASDLRGVESHASGG